MMAELSTQQSGGFRQAGAPSAWRVVLGGALAGGMGWGIRGQYGHETGAMIAGLLISLTLVLLLRPHAASLSAARAVAWGTVAIGFGGSMTYGQTIGLTQNPAMIGNHAALAWGLLGLAIKGGLWIGFAGVFLGMGLGETRYRPRELLLVLLGLLGCCAFGVWLLNTPFEPAERVLPRLYFSADWRWEPEAELTPRPEVWGGLLFALLGLLLYVGTIRRDRVARCLGLWGVLGGAVGFPLGQSLQAFRAWHPEVFRTGWWLGLDSHLNWWNLMEITFGATAGAALGAGVWYHRARLAALDRPESPRLGRVTEGGLLAVHVGLLLAAEFSSWPVVEALYDPGLVMGLIPVVAIVGGRWWPYLLVLPVTVLPIAAKTWLRAAATGGVGSPVAGVLVYLVVPLGVTALVAAWYARGDRVRQGAAGFLRSTLLLSVWLYFGLNFAFFGFPWPWASWTTRTPSALVFLGCALGLSGLALASRRGREEGVPGRLTLTG